jgi:predicted HicB family RNase H-like nuclease
MEQDREVLTLRLFPDLKQRVAAYAERRGLSMNAAATVLLDEALEAADARAG